MTSVDQRWVGVLVGSLVAILVEENLGCLVGGFVGAFYGGWRYRFIGAVMSLLCDVLVAIAAGTIWGLLYVSVLLLIGQSEVVRRCRDKPIMEQGPCYGISFTHTAFIFVGKLIPAAIGCFLGAKLANRWAWFSIVEQGNADAIRKLLQSGEDVNRADTSTGRTAIHLAAQTGNVGAMAVLLTAGALVDKPDLSACTALQYAAESGTLPNMKELIDPSRNLNLREIECCDPVRRQRIDQLVDCLLLDRNSSLLQKRSPTTARNNLV